MALGYGSEFHLLRMMGRHRAFFNSEILKQFSQGIDGEKIEWLDFNFSNSIKLFYDQELKGLNFNAIYLKEEFIQFEQCIQQFKKEWPQTGGVMNWDAVAYTDHNEIILVEAKAHTAELKSKCGAGVKSYAQIKKLLDDLKENDGINSQEDWLKDYYQMANRMYILELLHRNGIKAKLVNLFFTGDQRNGSSKCPQTKEDWSEVISLEEKYLGIDSQFKEKHGICDVFIDVKGKK